LATSKGSVVAKKDFGENPEITLVLGVNETSRYLTDHQKLALIQEKVEALLRNRMRLLSEEASTISSDMEALVMRLRTKGHLAPLGDIKSARWYRTAGDFKLLQRLYEFICSVTGRTSVVGHQEGDGDEDVEVVSESDE
jgi:hypothetical protein